MATESAIREFDSTILKRPADPFDTVFGEETSIGSPVSGKYERPDTLEAKVLQRRGLEFYRRGEYETAILHFSAALRILPNDSRLLSLRADAHRLSGHNDRAESDYTASLRADPTNVQAYLGRATSRRHLGELKAAAEDCDAALRYEPENAAAFAARAATFAAAAGVDDDIEFDRTVTRQAIDDYSAALKLRPNDLFVLFDRGKAYAGIGELELAIADFDRVVSLNPNYVAAHLRRGEAQFAVGRYSQAIADFSEVLRHDPENSHAYARRATVHAVLDDIDRAIDDYTEAIRIDPRDAELTAARSTLLRSQGEWQRAAEDARQALAIDSHCVAAHYNLAMTHAALRHWADAVASFDAVLIRTPDHLPAILNRAIAKERLGDLKGAVRDASRVLTLEPNSLPARLIRGGILGKLRLYDRAIQDLDSVLERDPEVALAYLERARVRAHRSDYSGAIEDYGTYLRFDPKCAAAYAGRGIARRLADQVESSIADFAQAIRLGGKGLLAAWDVGLAEVMRREQTPLLAEFAEGRRPTLFRSAVVDDDGETEAAQLFEMFEEAPDDVTPSDDRPAPIVLGAKSARVIAVECPLCGKVEAPGEHLADLRVRCAHCRAIFMPSLGETKPTRAEFHEVKPEPKKPPPRSTIKPRPKLEEDSEPTKPSKGVLIGIGISAAAVLVIGFFLFSGTSASGRLPVVVVQGKVDFGGKPTPGATVTLHSTKPRDPKETSPPPKPYGTVRDDGTFSIRTYEENDGAPPGDYEVTVHWQKIDPNVDGVGKSLLPKKYESPKTSGLKATVGESATTLPTISLKP